MDLFTGPVGSGQIHDFNPGIRAGGLFWTLPVSADTLDVDLERGTATLGADDLDVEDYHNLHNALLDGPSDPSTVSFEMRWTAVESAIKVTDPVHTFTGKFRISKVEIGWSAKVGSFVFVSDPPGTTVNVRSVIGRERNGVFFADD
jgi:hypothetical protein